jgi:SAM-dependent methyltransferase
VATRRWGLGAAAARWISDAAALRDAFGAADDEHFRWQTQAPYVAVEERRLVRRAFLPLGERILDVGCGEGATFVHLGAPRHAVGVDIFEAKLSFARQQLPGCEFVRTTGRELPFEDRHFDQVLFRDVIHHLVDPEPLLDECHRVLQPGGRIDLLEPCRYNPLVAAHALSHRAERGELRSTPGYLQSLLARRFQVVALERLQPLPLHRLLFHPRLGAPRLATVPWICSAVRGVEAVAEKLLPRPLWGYLHVRAQKPA